MIKLEAHDCSWCFLGAILAEYGVTCRHQGVILVAHVEGDGINETPGVHVVLFHRSFVPDLVYGSVVQQAEMSLTES